MTELSPGVIANQIAFCETQLDKYRDPDPVTRTFSFLFHLFLTFQINFFVLVINIIRCILVNIDIIHLNIRPPLINFYRYSTIWNLIKISFVFYRWNNHAFHEWQNRLGNAPLFYIIYLILLRTHHFRFNRNQTLRFKWFFG